MNDSVFCPLNTLQKPLICQSDAGTAVVGLTLWGASLLAGQ